MIMFNMQCNILLIRATWFMNDEILILLSFCVFIEMVNCLNTFILKSFLIIVFTSSLHLFYGTIYTTQNIFTRHIFFINRILGSITGDVMNTVTLSTWQYAPNTEIKLQQNKTEKH